MRPSIVRLFVSARLGPFATAFALAALPATAFAATPWPMAGGGPEHAGTAAGPAPPYAVAWRVDVGEGDDAPVAGPVTDGELLVLPTRERVVALDARSGDERWSVARERGVTGQAAIAGDLVLFTAGRGDDTELIAVATGDGEEAWSLDLGAGARGGVSVDGTRAYVGTDAGDVLAVALDDGAEEWRFETAGVVHAAPAVADAVVYAVGQQPEEGRATVHAIDALEGDDIWSVAIEDALRGATSGLAVAGDRVFVATGTMGMRALDVEDGSTLWERFARFPFGGSSLPAVPDDPLFVDLLGYVYLLGADTGEPRWLFRVAGPVVTGGAIVAGDAAVVADETGELSAIDLGSGLLVWRHAVGDDPLGALAADGDRLYAASHAGDVLAFEHDPDGERLAEPSPTTLFLGRTLLNYAAAFAIALVVIAGGFRLLRRED